LFPIILFGSTTLLTRMTGISLLMQWPLTSQLHGSVSRREQYFGQRFKLQKYDKNLVYLFPRQKLCIHFDKKWSG
jgi:hypothetical protein